MMNHHQVELVTNPTPNLSVHQWSAKGIRQLNRRNKLSSLPFWIPNDKYKKHQFRIVLLRGVVKGDTEEEDPVGVFLEYIAPPPGVSDSKGTPSGGAQEPQTSIGCKVTMRCLNRRSLESDDRSHDLCEQDTATITDEERQVGFKELIPASALRSREFTGDDGNALLIQVSIETGVKAVALMSVAKTTNQLASSLWSTFSSLTTQVQTIVKKTLQDVARDEDLREGGEAGAAAQLRDLPWTSAPAKWQSRPDKWRNLVSEHMVEDEATFLIGPKRGLSSDEQVLMTQMGINHRAIMAAESLFDYDRDVHEGLLTCLALRKQRYRLVPLRIKDENFWHNYFWKVTAVGTCERDDQVQLLLSVLNAVPLSPAKTSQEPFFQTVLNAVADVTTRPVTADEAATTIKEALEASDLLQEYTSEASSAQATGQSAEDTSMASAAAGTLKTMIGKLERLLSRRKFESDEVCQSLSHARDVCRARLDEHEQIAAAAVDGSGNGVAGAPVDQSTTLASIEVNGNVSNDEPKNDDEADAARVVEQTVVTSPTKPPLDQQPTAVTAGESTNTETAPIINSPLPPPAASAAKKSPSALPEDDFPTIDGLETPSPKQQQLPARTHQGSTDRKSTSAVEFAPMPWEEE